MADPEPKRESPDDALLRLYELAQQSAEHHDTLLWEVTYIIWGSTTLLLGFVLEAIKQEPGLAFITALLSIFLTIMVQRFAVLYRLVRNKKYEICKEIEVELDMKKKSHTLTTDYSPGAQTRWYWAATTTFIVVWVCVAGRSAYLLYVYHCAR